MRTKVLAFALLWAGALAAQPKVDSLTYRYDSSRSGANLQEAALTKANVKANAAKFGKLAFRNVDGNIYAQPLVVTQAAIANHGTLNVVIVATEHNSVYAFDADDTSADPPTGLTTKALWQRGPDAAPDGSPGLGTSIQTLDLYGRLGANGCTDTTTEVGVTSTPVIRLTQTAAPKQGIIFLVAKSVNGPAVTNNLYALNLADGKPLSAGTPIQGTVMGPNGPITFDALGEFNRPALLLDQNILYIAFGGHCDQGDYRGWVFAYDVSNASAPKQVDATTTTFTPRTQNPLDKNGRGGIWMSGYGPATDGSNIYLSTGDGSYNIANPSFLELSDSVVKTKLVSGKFQVQDWFSPQNRDQLKTFDVDLGSGGAVIVPNSHLLLAAGKEGRMYLIDRNNMGKGVNMSLQSFQVTRAPVNRNPNPQQAGDIAFWNIHGAPVIWPQQGQMFVYVMGEEDSLKQYKLVPDATNGWKFDTTFKKASKETVGLPAANVINDPHRDIFMPGGFLALSANATNAATGIIWATMPFNGNANMAVVQGALRAFDASDVSKGELWDSEASGKDNLGFFAKFNPPVVANGKVFVAAFQQERIDNGEHFKADGGLQPALVIYGLK